MRSDRGSASLIFALVLGCAAVGGGIYFFYRGNPNGIAESGTQAAFEALKVRVEAALNKPAVVSASVERNFNAFSCFYSANANCEGAGGIFQLFEGAQATSPSLSQLQKEWGVTVKGGSCRGFPSMDCPLRVEAEWSPVCRVGGPCEGTRSANIKVKVILSDGESAAQDWIKEELFSPEIKVSQSVTCERGGGVWANTECITPDQATQRQIASGGVASDAVTSSRGDDPATPISDVTCPNEIAIQGEYFPLESLGPTRSQVRVPAMNGCPAEDIFVFQCQARQAQDRDGQWIQVEAQMAPTCVEIGLPPQGMDDSLRQ